MANNTTLKDISSFTLFEHQNGETFLYTPHGNKYVRIENEIAHQIKTLLDQAFSSEQDSHN